MALAKSKYSDESGFSLAEVLTAVTVFLVGVVAIAQLITVAVRGNWRARVASSTMVLAQQKMEQLRGLMWGYDVLNLPLTDSTTNVSNWPFTSDGTGLSPSPPNTMTQNVPGFVDYLDEWGNWLGTGGTAPPRTAFVRRWSIEALPANPNNTLIIQVLVTRNVPRGQADASGSVLRLPDEARLVSVKTRKTI